MPHPLVSREHREIYETNGLLFVRDLGSRAGTFLDGEVLAPGDDWALIDLDPDGTPFPQVVQVARAVGKVLSAIGVKSSVKTSGAIAPGAWAQVLLV